MMEEDERIKEIGVEDCREKGKAGNGSVQETTGK